MNLVSVSSLLKDSYEVIFSRDKVYIKCHNVTFAFGIINNGLFQLQLDCCFICTIAHSLFLLVRLEYQIPYFGIIG